MNQDVKVYLNNPNLKAAGVEINFEPWQVQELVKCYSDPIYFIENYAKIVHIDKGLVPFKLYYYQKDIVRLTMENRYVLLKLPRQSGKSTTTAACILHYILFQEHKTVAILANKAATAREILSRIQMMYEHLPLWMQVGVTSWNKGSFSLGNGCKVIAASTSSSAIRGCIHGSIILNVKKISSGEEFDIEIEGLFEMLDKSSPDVSLNKDYLLKTPSGWSNFSSVIRYPSESHIRLFLSHGKELRLSKNHPLFTSLGWINAEDLTVGMEVITATGKAEILECEEIEERGFMYDPAYVETGNEGRVQFAKNKKTDEIVSLNLLEKPSEDWEIIEGNVGDQCYFANDVISSNTSISWLVLDEFAFVPPNQATEFFESVYPTISSGKESKISVFSTPKGMNHFYKMWVEATTGRSEFVPFEISWYDVPGRDEAWKEKTIANIGQESWEQEFEAQFLGSASTLLSPATLRRLVHREPVAQSGSLKVYEHPKPDHVYFLSVDCSRGAGIDYSVIQVTDITEYPFKQVAMFRDNKTNHYLLPRIIVEIAKKYNNGYVLVEINDIGEAVADAIYFDEEYENLLTTGESKGKIVLGSWKNGRNGVRTTKSTKREGCSIIKALIESNKYELRDWTTIQEFSTFISKNNSYEADEMCHDDTVMALVVFAWATGQEFFKEIMQKDFRKTFIEESSEDLMEELSPIGFFDGMDDVQSGEWEKVE